MHISIKYIKLMAVCSETIFQCLRSGARAMWSSLDSAKIIIKPAFIDFFGNLDPAQQATVNKQNTDILSP